MRRWSRFFDTQHCSLTQGQGDRSQDERARSAEGIMKAPVRELDDNESLKYAPKKPRRPEQDQNPDSAAPEVGSAPPPNMPKLSEPPWKQKNRHGASAGVVATGELRPRLSLMPDRVPQPQLPTRPSRYFARCGGS